jgi:hypothetical protein
MLCYMQVTIACVYAMLKEGRLDLDTLYATAAQLLLVLFVCAVVATLECAVPLCTLPCYALCRSL